MCIRDRYYPGDDFVDVMSFDFYQYGDPSTNTDFEQTLDKRLGILTSVARKHQKLPAFAETGFMNIPYAEDVYKRQDCSFCLYGYCLCWTYLFR